MAGWKLDEVGLAGPAQTVAKNKLISWQAYRKHFGGGDADHDVDKTWLGVHKKQNLVSRISEKAS